MLNYLTDQRQVQRPWGSPPVCISEPAHLAALPSAVLTTRLSVSVPTAPVAAVRVDGSGVSVVDAVQRVERQLADLVGMWPSRTRSTGTSGFTTAAKDNPTAPKSINDASGVPPRGRPV